MKQYLSTVLVIVSALLLVALVVTKHNGNAQLETDAGAITDYSNRLDTAQSQITAQTGTMLTLSNSLAECGSASLTLSNRLTETIALQTERITSLNRQVAATTSENQGLGRSVMDLTNQMAELKGQLAQTEASLTRTNQDLVQANKNYALLQNRFLRDVAERVVVERKFNNPDALRGQLKWLKSNPAKEISAERIYAELNVDVNSNGVAHVISPE